MCGVRGRKKRRPRDLRDVQGGPSTEGHSQSFTPGGTKKDPRERRPLVPVPYLKERRWNRRPMVRTPQISIPTTTTEGVEVYRPTTTLCKSFRCRGDTGGLRGGRTHRPSRGLPGQDDTPRPRRGREDRYNTHKLRDTT